MVYKYINLIFYFNINNVSVTRYINIINIKVIIIKNNKFRIYQK